MKYLGIEIDYARNERLTDFVKRMLAEFYLRKGEDPQEGYARAAVAYCAGDMGLAQRIYDYASKGWMMFASPVLSNAPFPGEPPKGLPISCFLCYVPDNLGGLIDHTTELRWLSVRGGGVGGHWSYVRSVSDIAPGPIPFLHTVDADMVAYRQGKTRKGSYAAYLDVSHPDIEEFLSIRVPTGDVQRKALNIHNAVNLSDAFMVAVENGGDWDLVDPHTHKIVKVVKARELWQRILEVRYRTGEPYLHFIDTANRALPYPLQAKGLRIHGSNLCNEIFLPTNVERTAVCCLSSVNLAKFAEWAETSIVEDLIVMLDNVLEFFIQHAPEEFAKSIRSATAERSLGLGAMGFHDLLQSRDIAWESVQARSLNNYVFSLIKSRATVASRLLAFERGEYPDGEGTGLRNAHLMAVAPNANNSILVGASPGIEPHHAVAYVHRMRAGAYLVKNRYFEQLLESLGRNTPEVWNSVITNRGSVQHLDFLTDHQKAVYKTAIELDQRWIVDLAADRQQHICQGQSLNLFFPAKVDRTYFNAVHLRAWKSGCKGLYYCRREVGTQVEVISQKLTVNELNDHCSGCDG